MWSRRKFLAALGSSASVAAASAWSLGCGSASRPSASSLLPRLEDSDYLHAFRTISSALPEAQLWSKSEAIYSHAIDSHEKHSDFTAIRWLVLRARVGATLHEILLMNPSPDQLANSAQQLATLGQKSRTRSDRPLTRHSRPDSLSSKAENDILDSLAVLLQRSEKLEESRIVFRSAYSRIVQEETVQLSESRHRANSETRSLQGLLVAAWTGHDIETNQIERAYRGSGEAFISDSDLRKSANEAMARLHARSAPPLGLQDVILSPACSALFIKEAFVPQCTTPNPGIVPTKILELSDNPIVGYGGYTHDDLGEPAQERVLVGHTPSLLGRGNWRRNKHAELRCVPSNLFLRAGQNSKQNKMEALLVGVDNGVLLDAPLHCSFDPDGQRAVLTTGIGYEVRNARLSGRVFSRLAMRVTTDDLLSHTRGLGSDYELFPFDLEGIPYSVRCPHWRSVAYVEPA